MKTNYSELQNSISYDGQIKDLRHQFDLIEDKRAANCSYSLSDLLMSIFAMFSLKYDSLLDFDNQTNFAKNNLKKIFGIQQFSSDSCLRKVLDKIDWKCLRVLFKNQFDKLKQAGIVESYQNLGEYLLISVDGVEHFSSKKIHCDCCLIKKQKDGTIAYTHSMLCAVMVHPDKSNVFVIGTEPIQCQDGSEKNDCERNASKRLINWLSKTYKEEKLLFLEDALYSTAPNIKQIQSNSWDFIIGVKPDSHKYLFRLLALRRITGKLIETHSCKIEKDTCRFYYFNDVSLNEANLLVKVNFLYCEKISSKGVVTRFSWVTSLLITTDNVVSIVKAGRARWKIENETFNTLKNQGYKFEHNYGHGHESLSSVFAHLMLLAFSTDQLIESCSKLFQKIRDSVVSRTKLWFCVRAAFFFKEYDSFKSIYVNIGLQFNVQLE